MITISIKDKQTGIQKEIAIKKTLSGDFLLQEHPDIDIIVMPQKFKILALAKEDQTDQVYNLQEKLFNYMVKKGVVLPESVISGNVYGSLQGSFPEQSPGGEDVLQVVIYNLANFIEDERPLVAMEKEFEDRMEKALLEPSVGFPTRGIYRYNY